MNTALRASDATRRPNPPSAPPNRQTTNFKGDEVMTKDWPLASPPSHAWRWSGIHEANVECVDHVEMAEITLGSTHIELMGFDNERRAPTWSSVGLAFKPATTPPKELAWRPAPKSFAASLISGTFVGLCIIGSFCFGLGVYQSLYAPRVYQSTLWKISSASPTSIIIETQLPAKRAPDGSVWTDKLNIACSLPCKLPNGQVATYFDPGQNIVKTTSGSLPISATGQ